MGLLGHWHRFVSIFDPIESVAKQIAEMAPDVIWTHMALWPPDGALASWRIAELLATWKRRGSAIYLHDGDPRPARKTDVDVGAAFSVALVNRSVDSGCWGIPGLRWPYAAMVQNEIGEPVDEWRCDLLFAGHLRDDELYGERTALVRELKQRIGGGMRVVTPGVDGCVNNRMLVADVAPSAGAVLGFGRPEVPGWIDTRVFQYPGAGGVLIHDDAGDALTPDEHFIWFDRSGGTDAVLAAVAKSRLIGGEIRECAFRHVQKHHTWVNRVQAALAAFFGA